MTNKFLELLEDIWAIGVFVISLPFLILGGIIFKTSSASKNPNFRRLGKEGVKDLVGNE